MEQLATVLSEDSNDFEPGPSPDGNESSSSSSSSSSEDSGGETDADVDFDRDVANSPSSSRLSESTASDAACPDCQRIREALSAVSATLVTCGAHTHQLAIMDAIKSTPGTAALLKKTGKLSKKLHCSKYATQLKALDLSLPAIPNKTRWSGNFRMLRSVRPLRKACCEIEAKEKAVRRQRQQKRRGRGRGPAANGRNTKDRGLPNLTNAEWDQLEGLHSAMEPAAVATLKFQQEQMTVGDFYGEWLLCKEKTRKLPSPFAAQLVRKMETRERELMGSDAVALALFMDPRY